MLLIAIFLMVYGSFCVGFVCGQIRPFLSIEICFPVSCIFFRWTVCWADLELVCFGKTRKDFSFFLGVAIANLKIQDDRCVFRLDRNFHLDGGRLVGF